MTETRMHEKMKRQKTQSVESRWVRILLAGFALIAGCSSGGSNQGGGPLPPAPAPSNATSYVGTQAPGFWNLSVDDTQNVFSYQPLSGTATSGGFALTNGVLDFGNSQGTSLGKAVAQPAGASLLRPGGPATYPVAMIQQSDCVPVAGKLRYIYAGALGQSIQRSSSLSNPGYGTFVVNTSSDGKTYAFSDVHNYVLTQFDFVMNKPIFAAGTENGTDPQIFSATCSSTGGVGTVIADANAAFAVDSTGAPLLPNFHFNPAGAMVEDRNSAAGCVACSRWLGFAEPQLAIKPSDIATGTYRGFVYEATEQTAVDTRPVAFAQPSAGGNVLSGGAFPSDDPTQVPGSEYTITLGTQDVSLNGVFPNARFTAVDSDGNCGGYLGANGSGPQYSFDANGNPTCTNAAIAVVSQISGKYVIYVTSIDQTRPTPGLNQYHDYLVQFYLYQQ